MLRVSEWAREHRRLSPESAATPGPFDPDVTPFMREVADSMGDPKVAEVRVMKSSQVAYSENLNNLHRAADSHLRGADPDDSAHAGDGGELFQGPY